MTTPRPDWKMPKPPPGYPIPFATLESGEAWELFWIAEDDDEPGADGSHLDPARMIEWPFGADELAGRLDLAALGFKVAW